MVEFTSPRKASCNETSMLIESERSSSLNDPTFYFLDQRQGSSVSDSHSPTLRNNISRYPWFKRLWNGMLNLSGSQPNGGASNLKPRKVPVKVEPKVFFSNERTFIAWMHMGVTLSTISIAILSFSRQNKWSQLYGLVMLPVAISFIVYAMVQYMRRAGMIRRREAGPYEDIAGPVSLAVLLMISVAVNFCLKLIDLTSKNNNQ